MTDDSISHCSVLSAQGHHDWLNEIAFLFEQLGEEFERVNELIHNGILLSNQLECLCEIRSTQYLQYPEAVFSLDILQLLWHRDLSVFIRVGNTFEGNVVDIIGSLLGQMSTYVRAFKGDELGFSKSECDELGHFVFLFEQSCLDVIYWIFGLIVALCIVAINSEVDSIDISTK